MADHDEEPNARRTVKEAPRGAFELRVHFSVEGASAVDLLFASP